jgi:hypothetical protein
MVTPVFAIPRQKDLGDDSQITLKCLRMPSGYERYAISSNSLMDVEITLPPAKSIYGPPTIGAFAVAYD